MARSSATLSTQLQAISGSTEAAAIQSWSSAFAAYFAGATANGVSFTTTPATIAAARAAMEAQMTGLSSSGQGDDKVQAGIIGWWDYVVANPGSCFSGASAVTKPTLTGIAAALVSLFSTNSAPGVTSAQACDAIAGSLHTACNGGQATISGNGYNIL